MLQTVEITATSAMALYKGRPVARVTDPRKVQVARNLEYRYGSGRAADYVVSVGVAA